MVLKLPTTTLAPQEVICFLADEELLFLLQKLFNLVALFRAERAKCSLIIDKDDL